MPSKLKIALVPPTWVVYCIKHAPSGCEYFGITSATLNIRWQQHVLGARRKPNTRFLKAIAELGEADFTGEVLLEGLSLEDAAGFESVLIQSKQPDLLFNEYAAGGSLLREDERARRGSKVANSAAHRAHCERMRAKWADPAQREKWMAARKPGGNRDAMQKHWANRSPEDRAAQLQRMREGRVRKGQIT